MAEVHHKSFISRLHFSISNGLPNAEPLSSLRADERELVLGILQMLQGFCSYFFYWDEGGQKYLVKSGIYVSHLSQTSLNCILNKFIFCGTCLKKVELFVKKVKASHQRAPTLEAFANSVHSWLKKLRDLALKEEMKAASMDCQMTTTLLVLTTSLSSMCSGAEHLAQVVHESISNTYINSEIVIPANKMAVRILDYLFKKLNEVCLVHDGEEEAYHMLLSIMGGSLLPYLKVLDSWLYEGFLDDPFEEVFFYANNAINIDQPAYWETSYHFRTVSSTNSSKPKDPLGSGDSESTPRVRINRGGQESAALFCSAGGRDLTDIECPMFLKELVKPIVSAGKSLQLIQHVQVDYNALFDKGPERDLYDISKLNEIDLITYRYEESCNNDFMKRESNIHSFLKNYDRLMGVLTLSEVFLVSLAGLVGDGDHIYEKLTMPSLEIAEMCKPFIDSEKILQGVWDGKTSLNHEKIWVKFLSDTIAGRKKIEGGRGASCQNEFTQFHSSMKVEPKCDSGFDSKKCEDSNMLASAFINSLYPHKPVITVSRQFIERQKASWNDLNISQSFHLPPLDDENLRKAIYTENLSSSDANINILNERSLPGLSGTDYTFGFLHCEDKQLHTENDIRDLEYLYSFPTLLPSFQEDALVSDLLPFQKNSSLSVRILSWIKDISFKVTPQPDIIIKECLAVYIEKQMDQIGRHILLKLMTDWKLMDELHIMQSIYLLGSGT